MRRRLGTVQDRVEENICPFLLGAGIRSISTPVPAAPFYKNAQIDGAIGNEQLLKGVL